MYAKQAREVEQESGTPMRRIMSGSQLGGLLSGRGFVDYSQNGEHTPPPTTTGHT